MLEGQVDNAACPAIDVKIVMTLGTPKNSSGKVPVLMMFSFFGSGRGPGAARPGAAQAPPRRFGPPGPSARETLVKAGWGYALISPVSIQAAWRQHDGGHTDAPNVTHFITWAERHLRRSAAAD